MRKLLLLLTLLLPLTGAATEARGYVNNNPGNLVKTSIPWQGKVQCADKRFECFSSPYFGIRAMTKTLIAYKYLHKLSSIPSIVNRWSPSNENNTRDFISYLYHNVGYLGASFNSKLPQLVHHIIRFETGYSKYSITYIEGVVHATLRNSNLARIHAARRCDEAMVNETASRQREAPADNGSSWSSERGTYRDTWSKERKVHMDTTVHSYNSGTVGIRPAEASAFLRPRRGVWMDGVQSRVLVLYRW